MFDKIEKFICNIYKTENMCGHYDVTDDNDHTSVKFKHRHYNNFYKCYASVEQNGKIIYINCKPWFDDESLEHRKIENRKTNMYLTKKE